jgi:N-acetylglutamate synthase-like GNAT family acetyltransferase
MECYIAEINTQSKEYPQLLEFRNQWLRLPLGLNLFDEDLSDDEQDRTLVVMQDDAIAGCIMLHPIDKKTVKFRQMAIHPKLQGRGIGKTLLEDAEHLAKEIGFEKIELHARYTAIGFYERAGYEIISEPFTEVTIPHAAMQKLLS